MKLNVQLSSKQEAQRYILKLEHRLIELRGLRDDLRKWKANARIQHSPEYKSLTVQHTICERRIRANTKRLKVARIRLSGFIYEEMKSRPR